MQSSRTTKAGLRPRARLALVPAPALLLLAGLLPGCGSDAADVPDPPVPPNLAGFDPRAAARIREAVARVEQDRHRGQAWADLGTLYTSERLKGHAIRCFAVAESLEPRQPRWPYRAAIMLAQNGALEEASAAMGRSIALEPSYPPSHARLGNYRLDLGDLDGAERCYRTAIELDSTYPAGWLGLARVELQRDRPAAAVAILERLCAEDPESGTFRQLLATARRQLDPTAPISGEGVLADQEVQVWNDPWELETRVFARTPLMLQVGQLLEHGRAQEALTLLEEERARGADPDELALSFATAHARLGNGAEARRELAALLARQPDNVRALMLHMRLLDDAGDLAGVVATLERLTALQPDYGGGFAAKAKKLAELGQHERAVEAYRRALELGVRDYELRCSLGNSLVVLRRWPEALELFATLLEERPDDGNVWLQVALAHLRQGRLDEGQRALERGQATGKATPRLHENVRKVLEEQRALRAARGPGEGG